MASIAFKITPSSSNGGIDVEFSTSSGEDIYTHTATTGSPAQYTSDSLPSGSYRLQLTNNDGLQNIYTYGNSNTFVTVNGESQEFQFVSDPDEAEHFSRVVISYQLGD